MHFLFCSFYSIWVSHSLHRPWCPSPRNSANRPPQCPTTDLCVLTTPRDKKTVFADDADGRWIPADAGGRWRAAKGWAAAAVTRLGGHAWTTATTIKIALPTTRNRCCPLRFCCACDRRRRIWRLDCRMKDDDPKRTPFCRLISLQDAKPPRIAPLPDCGAIYWNWSGKSTPSSSLAGIQRRTSQATSHAAIDFNNRPVYDRRSIDRVDRTFLYTLRQSVYPLQRLVILAFCVMPQGVMDPFFSNHPIMT